MKIRRRRAEDGGRTGERRTSNIQRPTSNLEREKGVVVAAIRDRGDPAKGFPMFGTVQPKERGGPPRLQLCPVSKGWENGGESFQPLEDSGKKFPMFGTVQRKDAEVAEFRKADSLRSFASSVSLRLLPLA